MTKVGKSRQGRQAVHTIYLLGLHVHVFRLISVHQFHPRYGTVVFMLDAHSVDRACMFRQSCGAPVQHAGHAPSIT